MQAYIHTYLKTGENLPVACGNLAAVLGVGVRTDGDPAPRHIIGVHMAHGVYPSRLPVDSVVGLFDAIVVLSTNGVQHISGCTGKVVAILGATVSKPCPCQGWWAAAIHGRVAGLQQCLQHWACGAALEEPLPQARAQIEPAPCGCERSYQQRARCQEHHSEKAATLGWLAQVQTDVDAITSAQPGRCVACRHGPIALHVRGSPW